MILVSSISNYKFYTINNRLKTNSYRFLLVWVLVFILTVFYNELSAQRVQHKVFNDTTYMESKGVEVKKVFYNNGTIKSIERTKDSLKEGIQELYYPNGIMRSISEFSAGKPHGSFLSYDANGILTYRKTYIYLPKENKSVLNGPFEQYHNQQITLKAYYKKDLKQGKYEVYRNGKIIEASFYKEGLLTGTQKKYYDRTGGLKFERNYKIITQDSVKTSVLHGKSVYYSADGNIGSSGSYKQGKKEGDFTEYFNNSVTIRSIIAYRNDLKNGPYKYYYRNGYLEKSGLFIETKNPHSRGTKVVLDGICLEYYKNGLLKSTSTYDKGIREGAWFTYYENGNLKEKSKYLNGLKSGLWTYKKQDGTLYTQIPYKIILQDSISVSVKDGVEKRWNNGVLASTEVWVNGKLHGQRIGYYPNGVVGSRTDFVNGELDGKALEYYDNGNLKSDRTYKIIILNGRNKRVDSGWRSEYEEDGTIRTKYFYGPTGNPLVTYQHNNGEISHYSLRGVITLYYLPNGDLMSYNIANQSSYSTLKQYYYINGNTRKIQFQNTNNGINICANYTCQDEFVLAYTERHHNPDSLLPSKKIIKQHYKALGKDRISNDFYTDPVKDGKYTIRYANGKPMLEMEFIDDLPVGGFTHYQPLSGDTIWHRAYTNLRPQGYFIYKYANGNISRRGETFNNGNERWFESFEFNGTPSMKAVFNDAKERIEYTEYYKNGQIKSKENKLSGYSVQYRDDGKIISESIKEGDVVTIKRYYSDNGNLQSEEQIKNQKRVGLSKHFWPSGQLKYLTTYVNGKRDGLFVRYAKDGSLVAKGNFVNEVQVGQWLTLKNGIMDTLTYKNGKVVVTIPNHACACVDTAYSSNRLRYAPSLKGQVEFDELVKFIPDYLKFTNQDAFESIFYTGYQPNNSRSQGSVNMNLLMFDPVWVNLPADEQIRVTFNPCRTRGYISRMNIWTTYQLDNPAINTSVFYPKRVSIALIKGPMKSDDVDYSYFTAFLNTKEIRVSQNTKFQINPFDNPNYCFTKGVIKDFLHLEVIKGKPVVFESTWYNSSVLTDLEKKNFFGFVIQQGDLSFTYTKDNITHKIDSKVSYLLAGGKYVYGIINIPCERTAIDTYAISTTEKDIVISGQNLKVDWLKRGFTRLRLEYNEKDKLLSIHFFVE